MLSRNKISRWTKIKNSREEDKPNIIYLKRAKNMKEKLPKKENKTKG